jgi:hypothetical protein
MAGAEEERAVARLASRYQVGVLGGRFAREMAALLACGAGAAISHWAVVA